MGKLIGIARRDQKRGEMQTIDSAEVTEASGVQQDFRGKPGPRQVAVIAARVWRDVCSELGRDIPWTARRANLLVDAIDLPAAAGGTLQIGSVRLQIHRETDPCSRMDEQCPGLTAALQPDWRGGVCCSVVTGGTIAIGDPVSLQNGTIAK